MISYSALIVGLFSGLCIGYGIGFKACQVITKQLTKHRENHPHG